MNRCLRTAALLAALMLICTACTDDGGWLDRTRLSFNTRGIDSVLTTEDRTNSSLPEMVSRDQEVLAVLDVDTPAVDCAQAAYSADNGASWQPVLFDGKADPGMDLVSVAAVREDQWLLVGHRNRQAFAFTSHDGKEFTLQPTPIFDTTRTTLNAAVGTGHGWLIATSPQRQGKGAGMTLHRSTDGSAWSATEGTAAGLPAAGGSFHPLSMAGSPVAVLLVGQQDNANGSRSSRAFSSSDGGSSWQDVSPDAWGIGPRNNGLWTATWTGSEFRVTGYAWPHDSTPRLFPIGMSGSWTPGVAWSLQADPGWSRQDHDFPRQSKVGYGPTGAVATQMIGQLADGKPKVLLQLPGQPWTELQMPEPADGELRLFSAVAAVADGFLVTGTNSSHGNDRVRIWHVDGSGRITERASPLQVPARGGDAGDKPYITKIVNTGGKTIAFGSLRSQPAIWELDGDRNFSNYTTFSSEDNQTLDRISVGARGQMLLGSTRTANGQLPVIWSRPDGQEWSVYARNIFGSETRYGESPVSAVLPSSHGFLAAGSYYTDGANHAGLAVSEDGEAWSQVQSGELRGSASAGRSIAALAETPARTVLAGGYIEESQGSSPAVWASLDAQTWKTVPLPRAEGYVDGTVVSLTPGPLRTVAVVHSRASGKPARYSTFTSGDDGLTWEPGTDLDAVSPGQALTAPRIVANGGGFVLLATQGSPGHHTALLMLSQDGNQFAARELSHSALDQEGLTLSAAGIDGKKLLITGMAGPADRREPFGIAVDVPAP